MLEEPPLAGMDVVCLSISPWEGPITSTAHQLMRHVARHNRVLFVERPLTMLDLPRSDRVRRGRTLGMRQRLRHAGEGDLWVLTPPPVASINFLPEGDLYRGLLSANGRILARSIQQAMARLGMRRPILWVAFEVPLGLAVFPRLNARLLVYHCYDLIGGEGYVARHGVALERELASRADVVLTTSTLLQERMSAVVPPFKVHLVPNGVDHAQFSSALAPETRPDPRLAGLAHPILGYVGNLEDRIDWDLLDQVALAFEEGTLLLVGPIKPGFERAMAHLRQRPNVRYLGPVPHGQLPGVLAGLDLGLIPFVRSPQTSAIYPLKLHEYLASGLPVVATPFSADVQALGGFQGSIAVAPPVHFVDECRRALCEGGERTGPQARARSRLAMAHDWKERAAQVQALLAAALDRDLISEVMP